MLRLKGLPGTWVWEEGCWRFDRCGGLNPAIIRSQPWQQMMPRRDQHLPHSQPMWVWTHNKKLRTHLGKYSTMYPVIYSNQPSPSWPNDVKSTKYGIIFLLMAYLTIQRNGVNSTSVNNNHNPPPLEVSHGMEWCQEERNICQRAKNNWWSLPTEHKPYPMIW